MCLRLYTILVFFVFVSCNAPSNKTTTDITQFEIFQTSSQDLTIEDIQSKKISDQFKSHSVEGVSLGYTSNTIWVRFKVGALAEAKTRLYLQVAYSLDDITLFSPHSDNNDSAFDITEEGENIPYYKREYKYRRHLFAVTPSSGYFYLRIRSETAMQIPISVISDKELVEEIQNKQFFWGVYNGIMALTAIFVWALYLKIRRKHFFFYSLYIQCCFLLQVYIRRLPKQWFPEFFSHYNKSIIAVLASLIVTFSGLFIYHYLYGDNKRSKFSRGVLQILIALSLIVAGLDLYFPYRIMAPITWYFCMVAMIYFLVFFAKDFLFFKNAEQLYFIGIICYFIGNLATLFYAVALIPISYIATNGLEIGSSIQSVFFLFGVACAIRILHQEKAQHEKRELLEQEKSRALTNLNNLAQQVAHDIRSPLAALSVVAMNVPELAEDKRIMIRSAVQRIDDIANDLAYSKSKKLSTTNENQTEELSIQLLSGLIDSLISEKRLQHRTKLGVTIQSSLDSASYGLFAKVQPVQFKRILSNLINNAAEAFKGNTGLVDVRLFEQDSRIGITVADNGPGIPQDVLPKLMQKGASFGKEQGSGLGLWHAKESIQAMDGTIVIDSTLGKGTIVTITLPKQISPSWFVPEIVLSDGMRIVILDDDSSIHQIWTARLDSAGVKRESVFHFTTTSELEVWQNANVGENQKALFLCDYELIGSSLTGLEIIKKLHLEKQAILVTSRFEEKDIRNECAHLGIKFIPKNLAGFVPIKVESLQVTSQKVGSSQESVANILIDDSEMNRNTWTMVARLCKKNLVTFADPKEFYAVIDQYDRNTTLYIDSELADGVKGEIVAKDLSEKGFCKIYLATGHPAAEFENMPWLTGIVGKNPPFKRS